VRDAMNLIRSRLESRSYARQEEPPKAA